MTTTEKATTAAATGIMAKAMAAEITAAADTIIDNRTGSGRC